MASCSPNAYNYDKIPLPAGKNCAPCADILVQLGVFGQAAVRPNGAVEPVAILDDAIRQVKSYLLDDINGPCACIARVDADLQAFKPTAVLKADYLDNSILVANEAGLPVPLVFGDFTVLARQEGDDFETVSMPEDSILARSGTNDIAALELNEVNAIVGRAGGDLKEIQFSALHSMLLRGGSDLIVENFNECDFLTRPVGGELQATSLVETWRCLLDDTDIATCAISELFKRADLDDECKFPASGIKDLDKFGLAFYPVTPVRIWSGGEITKTVGLFNSLPDETFRITVVELKFQINNATIPGQSDGSIRLAHAGINMQAIKGASDDGSMTNTAYKSVSTLNGNTVTIIPLGSFALIETYVEITGFWGIPL